MTLKLTPSYNEVGWTDRKIKEIKIAQWMRTVDAPDHVRAGFTVTDAGGLVINIAIGEAMLYGYLVENDSLIAPDPLTPSTTNHVYLKIVFDGQGRANAAAIEVNTTGVAPQYSTKLATVVTSTDDITSLTSNAQLNFLHATGGHTHVGTSGQGPTLTNTALPVDQNSGIPYLDAEGDLWIKGAGINTAFIADGSIFYNYIWNRTHDERVVKINRNAQNAYTMHINVGDGVGNYTWSQVITQNRVGAAYGVVGLNSASNLINPGNVIFCNSLSGSTVPLYVWNDYHGEHMMCIVRASANHYHMQMVDNGSWKNLLSSDSVGIPYGVCGLGWNGDIGFPSYGIVTNSKGTGYVLQMFDGYYGNETFLLVSRVGSASYVMYLNYGGTWHQVMVS
jgi:hypothetical protein